MKVRTFILTAGAVLALVSPAVAGARMLPTKQKQKVTHAAPKKVWTRQGQPMQPSIYVATAVMPLPEVVTSQASDAPAEAASSDDGC